MKQREILKIFLVYVINVIVLELLREVISGKKKQILPDLDVQRNI